MKQFKKYRLLIIILLFLALWSVLMWSIGPETIVEYIGIKNTYLVVFILAVIGGLSAVTGISFFATVATFAAGGSHPLALGLIGGLGIFLSDLIFFLIAQYGTLVFNEKLSPLSIWLAKKKRAWPEWLIPFFVYFYLGFTPLPNDLLMMALALAKVPLRRLWLPILAGSLTIVTITAYLSYFLAGVI
ncbi:MAG: hypothetical protein WDZ85_02800 [Candidatus Paceibacterota bacterium]